MTFFFFRAQAALASIILLFSASLQAADWPQFLGPRGDGTSEETTWNQDWSRKEPQELWKAEVGTGCSAVSIAAGKAYTIGQAGAGKDTVFCFDAITGKEVWAFKYEQKLEPNYYSGGPSSTPLVDLGKVYVVSKDGEVYCLDAKTGKTIWRKSFSRDFAGEKQMWGYASSPIVSGDMLILEPGGAGSSVVALHKITGDLFWKSGTDKASYATPVLFENSIQKGLVSFNQFGLVGYELTGKELFRQEWKTQYDVNASSPLHRDGHFLISSNYGSGCALIKTGASTPEVVWRNKELMQQFQNMVLVGNEVYAVSGDNQTRASLKCLDFMTGKLHWEERLRENRGNILVAAGKLLVLSESGELLLVQPDAKGFQQLGSHQVNKKPCWAPPAFSDGLLYTRNNDGRVTCIDLR
jgi:outer membrane protein assembly factor BamB